MIHLLLPLLCLAVSAQRWTQIDKPNLPRHEGSVRLVGGSGLSGRVEVYHDGKWGTVCDDGWDLPEAKVVCRQLGFAGAKSAASGGSYGEGSGKIWLDDMSCTGSENSLSDCRFKGWGVTDCSHKEDAGVVCDAGKNKTSDKQFLLDHSLGLSDDLGIIFDSGEESDFTVLVQDFNEEAELMFSVHRFILLMYPHLDVSNHTGNITLKLSQTCHSHVSAFLRYLYTRQIDVSITSAQCLHHLAFTFGAKKLMEDVGRIFTVLIPEDNTFQTQISMYDYGVRTGDLVLQENVLQFLSWNCELLISSPAWSSVSLHMMDALLLRSDLVVKDEAVLLEALESWIQDRGEAVGLDQQAALLKHIRFMMIPVDKLYDLQLTSRPLQQNHQKLYANGFLSGFQFNALSFSKIRKQINTFTDEYLPRVYTAEEWSVFINETQGNYMPHNYNHYPNSRYRSFSTPAHTSALFNKQTIQWQAQVFLNNYECVNHGIRCDSLPAARLTSSGRHAHSGVIRFSNRLIVSCKKQNTIVHVLDFKNDMVIHSLNLSSPCPDDYSFRFVVRPEYV